MATNRGFRDPNEEQDPNRRQLLQALKDEVQTLGGDADVKDRHAVRFEDLVSAQLVTIDDSGNVTRVLESDLDDSFQDDPDGSAAEFDTLVGEFDATSGRDVGVYSSGVVVPASSVVVLAWYDVITPFASAGAPTIAIGLDVDDPSGITTAALYSSAIYSSGFHDGAPNNTSVSFSPGAASKTTAARNIIVTVAGTPVTDSLTAGRMKIFARYIRSS